MPFTKIAQMVLMARAVDKKYFETLSPIEPLIQIENNFTEMFIMPSTKIA